MSKRLGRIAIREQTLNHAQYEYERELEKKKRKSCSICGEQITKMLNTRKCKWRANKKIANPSQSASNK
jgi:hypothetical protein